MSPPGTLKEILAHPYYNGVRSVELALFAEHRYAFYYWNKWTRGLIDEDYITHSPALVSLDWHQDLVWPTDGEKKLLSKLNLSSNKDVTLFSWANLRPLNDTQILSAAYLNLIGDIYVHCRQGKFEHNWEDEMFEDVYGNIHTVKKFKSYESLEKCLLESKHHHVYFDIDLDFFTLNNPYNGVGKSFTYLKKAEIEDMLKVDRPLINWIFERLCGITIATEPEHTGGLLRSNKLLDIIDRIYFKPSLFSNYGSNWKKSCHWRHLPKR